MNVPNPSHDETFITMVTDHMEQGFLENIIDMFKHDTSLYAMLPHLVTDERIVVRIGTTALMETLQEEDADNVQHAVAVLIPLLEHHDPTVRGDTANILGLIADTTITDNLSPLLHDDNPQVRMIAQEALDDIQSRKHH